MECGISNNLADFDTPLHVVTGFQGDNLDELQTNLKTKKILGVDEGGGVEVKTVDIPYQARKAKADEDEKISIVSGWDSIVRRLAMVTSRMLLFGHGMHYLT